MTDTLPIEEIKTSLLPAWHSGGAVISAPPGSGKTTQIPLWLLEHSQQTIYLLIPKRLAVKLASQQLARNLGEPLGKTVGYQLRQERQTSAETRLIVTTYGSFLRLLLNDPDQIAHSTIIFDEFHERSVEQDLCYALINQYVELFDSSVRRLIMSATLNVQNILEQTALPLIESDGFSYPVDIQYRKCDVNRPADVGRIIEAQAGNTDHHILVFCAGLREIRQLEKQLGNRQPILILHGQLDKTPNIQTLASDPPTIILATNIAESSVTLPRVHTVIDLGLERYADTNPVTGINTLKTRRISQASAAQRAGRAGRLGPGNCIRLWSIDEHAALIPHQPPQITHADLTDLVLQTLHWGAQRDDLVWLDKPAASRWQLACDKLANWQAITRDRQLTNHGSAMQNVGLDPWLSHLIALAEAEGNLASASILAAYLMTGTPINFDPRQPLPTPSLPAPVVAECKVILNRFDQSLPAVTNAMNESLLIRALADRLICWRTPMQGQLISGTEVHSREPSNEQWGILLDGVRQQKHILATHTLPVSSHAVTQVLTVENHVQFKPNDRPAFLQTTTLGKIVLSQQPTKPSQEERTSAWLRYISERGDDAFVWTNEALNLKQRWQFALKAESGWPDYPSSAQWVDIAESFMMGIDAFEALPITAMMEQALGYDAIKKLNAELPHYWTSPTGRKISIDYDIHQLKASVSLKLQEAFGLSATPLLLKTIPLTLHLTAPNGRPLASVTDLSFFWDTIYPQVRKEMRGRYAKHPWPEDPLAFTATSKTNRQLRSESGSG